jgi:hypothetical protein
MKPVETTRDRFLTAVAGKVDAAAIAEVHLFQPIKQGGLESGVAVVAVKEPVENRDRLAVYTAQYRLTLKGPDRGKWEFSMQADADAPLLTVDAVVRGVQRRVADAVEPVRLSGEDFRAQVPLAPAPNVPA